jgi:hypothetical protein
MRPLVAFALSAALAAPAAAAADIAPLYPDAAAFALGVNVKGTTTSPLGKKVIGTDKPFDATRKLLRVLFPDDLFTPTKEKLQPLEAVANTLDNVTVVGSVFGEDGPPPVVVFLEGSAAEGEYLKAAEGFAKAEGKPFDTDKLGDRTLFTLGRNGDTIYGVRVADGLFVLASRRELIDEVLDKHAGRRKAKVQQPLLDWIKAANPAETPIWLAVGEIKNLDGVHGGVATIALKDGADFRIEVRTGREDLAASVKQLGDVVVNYFKESDTPQGKVWNAAGLAVKQDGTTVTMTGRFPGKLLADEYAKQK